jgi:hypothetical protein
MEKKLMGVNVGGLVVILSIFLMCTSSKKYNSPKMANLISYLFVLSIGILNCIIWILLELGSI